jgi:hypothetical protein
MRRLAILSTLLASLTAVPDAAMAFNGRFTGGGTVFDYSHACVNAGWIENSAQYMVRFEPANVGYNPDRSLLAFFSLDRAFAFQVDGQFLRTWQEVDLYQILDDAYLHPSEHRQAAQVRFRSISPSRIDAETAGTVRIRGEVRNFAATPGCRVTFELLLQQQS